MDGVRDGKEAAARALSQQAAALDAARDTSRGEFKDDVARSIGQWYYAARESEVPEKVQISKMVNISPSAKTAIRKWFDDAHDDDFDFGALPRHPYNARWRGKIRIAPTVQQPVWKY